MILIDTSAWIEFFRKAGNSEAKARVAESIDRDEAAYTCPVYFELLTGARPKEIPVIEETLFFCEHCVFKAEFWTRAAQMERALRTRGILVPRDDVFVATVAWRLEVPLLCRDRHFELIRDIGGFPLTVLQLQ